MCLARLLAKDLEKILNRGLNYMVFFMISSLDWIQQNRRALFYLMQLLYLVFRLVASYLFFFLVYKLVFILKRNHIVIGHALTWSQIVMGILLSLYAIRERERERLGAMLLSIHWEGEGPNRETDKRLEIS